MVKKNLWVLGLILSLVSGPLLAARGGVTTVKAGDDLQQVTLSGDAALYLANSLRAGLGLREGEPLKGKQLSCFPVTSTCSFIVNRQGVMAPGEMVEGVDFTGKAWALPDLVGNKKVDLVVFDRDAAQSIYNHLNQNTSLSIGLSKQGPDIRCVSAGGEAQCRFYLSANGDTFVVSLN